MTMRIERDGLGEMPVPQEAYYGIMTVRSQKAYDVGPRTLDDYPLLIKATALIKIAAARANCEVGALEPQYAKAIEEAAWEIVNGDFKGQFIVNIFRGAGTPVNMAVNEVIAHRANERLFGTKEGKIHKNTHVNMGQSTGDVSPTSRFIVVHDELDPVLCSLDQLIVATNEKAHQWAGVIKMGRTLAQDALPVTLGMDFATYASALRRVYLKMRAEQATWNRSVMGGTAIGTGMGAAPGYRRVITKHLSAVLGRPIQTESNLPDAMGATDDLYLAHSHLECLALVLWRMARDINFMASGPVNGLGELNLPDDCDNSENRIPVPEMIIQSCQKVFSNRNVLLLASESGWLEMGPTSGLVFKSFIDSADMLDATIKLFTEMVQGLTANVEHCKAMTEKSTALATMVSAFFGYEVGTKVAHLAIDENITCKEATKKLGILPDDVIEEIFDPTNLVNAEKLEALSVKYRRYRHI